MIELLSPAGDFERLKFALRYGADAVYIGGKNYSLRANAINFTNEEIKEATKFAHSLNKKVYVTVNIVLHDENIDGLKEYLLFLDSVNVDAIIVSDIYIMSLWKELNLKMELHVSTQASTLNKETALSIFLLNQYSFNLFILSSFKELAFFVLIKFAFSSLAKAQATSARLYRFSLFVSSIVYSA